MANFQLKLTPDLINMGTEGSMDGSLDADGNSLQRTGYIDVYNSTNRVIASVADGETFANTITTWDDADFIVAL